MATVTYRIPEAPEFSPAQIREYWTMNPETHIALGFCPQHQKRVQLNSLDHVYGRQPSCALCGEWLTTLDLVAL